ncbi:MAG: type II secretion system protein [Alphaproteobacteria bacterium]|jgi:prepilin-type N-terminal cleavage/methylation domain-containing protein|nr:prepilin-type N-terminal cleavage/methylation domain-containing protein [Alphaproteobacteria bacterium]
MTRHALKRAARAQDGFSLVELSIALLIIGLIVGGVLKGQELLESARLKSALTQVNEFRLATGVFMDKYNALPGDFDKASDYIASHLKNGNNDGVIEGPGLSSTGPGHEALSYWQHLSAANLLPTTGQLPSSGVATFGSGAPRAKIGGGFTIQYDHFGDAKHWYLLGQENGDRGNGALLTPQQAMSIDQKADSGRPKEGQIRAEEGVGAAPGSCVTPQGAYNGQTKDKACVLYFQM